jgi:hypothetical protein
MLWDFAEFLDGKNPSNLQYKHDCHTRTKSPKSRCHGVLQARRRPLPRPGAGRRHHATPLANHQELGRARLLRHPVAGAATRRKPAGSGAGDGVVHVVVHGDDPVHGLLHRRQRAGAFERLLQGPRVARRRRGRLPLPRHERGHRQPHAGEHGLHPRVGPPGGLRRRVAGGKALQMRK